MEIPIKLNLPDQKAVGLKGQALLDVVVAESGVRLRPGTSIAADTGEATQIDGWYFWEEQEYIVIVCNGNCYKISNAINGGDYLLLENGEKLLLEGVIGELFLEQDAVLTDVTGDASTVNQQVLFANYGDILYFANGGTIKELHPSASVVSHGGSTYTAIKNSIAVEPGVTSGWATYWSLTGTGGSAWSASTRYGSGNADALEDAQAPTSVDFVATADAYLFAIESNSQTIHFSVVDQPWSFDSDFISAEHLPDDANCMQVLDNDVWVGGRRSIESFVNDGSTPWIRSGYGAINTGVLAPYSFIKVRQSFIWIDETRRLVTLSGRDVTPLNPALDTYLNDLTTLNDAISSHAVIDGIEYYILFLPTEDKTIAVNLGNNSWSEWDWDVREVKSAPLWGTVYASDANGYLLKMETSDDTDSGSDIPGTIRTPRVQTTDTIRPARLVVGVSKIHYFEGTGTSSLRFRFRDDNNDWSNWKTLTFSAGATDHVLRFNRIGSYKNTRQYEFDLSDCHPFAMTKVIQE